MMFIIITVVCLLIFAVFSSLGGVRIVEGWLERDLASVKSGRLYFILGLIFEILICLVCAMSFSPLNFTADTVFYIGLFVGSLATAIFFSALLECMLKEHYIDGKTEEAPEKSEDIPSDLDGRVEYWHTHDTGNTLQEFLGMTDSEYEKWGRGEYNPAAEDNEKEDN
jgi:hypothetical protein